MTFKEYEGQTVFVTGAASGIGAAQVAAFIARGANVFGLDVNEDGLVALRKKYGMKFSYEVASVKNKDEVKGAVKGAVSQFNEINILLNTAGVLDGFAKTLETDELLWDHIMDTNVKGTYFVTNEVLPYMLAKKTGIIVNMASIAGMIAGGGGAAYTASKHAIIGYTKQLDYDYGKEGIRINAIAPGAIQTPMNKADFEGDGEMAKWVAKETPAGRWAKPEEVANLTLYMASNAADYLRGTVIPFDGGWLNK